MVKENKIYKVGAIFLDFNLKDEEDKKVYILDLSNEENINLDEILKCIEEQLGKDSKINVKKKRKEAKKNGKK